jgi:hypothetical protein
MTKLLAYFVEQEHIKILSGLQIAKIAQLEHIPQSSELILQVLVLNAQLGHIPH